MGRKIAGRELNALTVYIFGSDRQTSIPGYWVYRITPCGGLILEGGFKWPEPKGTEEVPKIAH
jgi:hypothetical protein